MDRKIILDSYKDKWDIEFSRKVRLYSWKEHNCYIFSKKSKKKKKEKNKGDKDND
jgi:hypothetical protein